MRHFESSDIIFADSIVNVSATLKINAEFYNWAFTNHLFPQTITSVAQAQNFCEKQECEQQPPTLSSCCIWRFYINACPTNANYTNQSSCGPWLPAHGIIIGSTPPQYGLATKEVWNASIQGLKINGEMIILATFFIGLMKISMTTSIASITRAGLCSLKMASVF